MTHRLFAIALPVCLGAGLVAGQSAPAARPAPQGAGRAQTAAPAPQASASTAVSPDDRYRRAVDAWNDGKYPDALGDLVALMKSPAAAEYRDRVALLTGELFTTTELTADGRNPRISANGQYASYETGPANDPLTRVVRMAATPQLVVELHATNVAFDPSGAKLAWIRTPPRGDQPADAKATEIMVRDLTSGSEAVWVPGGMAKSGITWLGDGRSLVFVGVDPADPTRSDVFQAGASGTPVRLTNEPGLKANVMVDPRGMAIVYAEGRAGGPGRAGGGAGGGGGGGAAGGGGAGAAGAGAAGAGAQGAGRPGGAAPGGGRGPGGGVPAGTNYVVVDVAAKSTRTISGTALTMSADGSTLAWLTRTPDAYTLNSSPTLVEKPAVIRTTTGVQRIDAPVLSPDGKLVAYQFMSNVGSSTDWEIYVSDAAGTHRRITRDIQHDLLPRFLTNDALIGMIGEARHRRAHLYDLATGSRSRIFANNTIRTISPEYIWLPSADGTHLAISAERDGDTVSAERGVYVVNLTRKVTTAEVLARLDQQLTVENDLRARMTKAFQPIADLVRKTVATISPYRAYEYEKAQFDFDSKHVSQPGNAKAIEYLARTYASFGYSPEIQSFPVAQALGGKTANIVSTLKGTENPELIYVVSSHFDSVAGGPGADDDTSGTVALLETARALAHTPMPATIVFASFTGEEAGLLGSREFVRQAGLNKWKVVGALNNDMIGWAGESTRMDNTIRYSNAGIKEIQHGAAFLFTRLVLYDAKYYKGTDANAFYDGWGDIVGGIGSYPVLSNPNYHQPSDLIETINFQQVAETAKVTAATLMYLASSPSRLKDVTVTKTAAGVDVTWTPSPEAGVKSYIVAYGPANDPLRTRTTVGAAKAALPALPAGTQIAVKAVNSRGLEGWDWARAVVQ